ncbi:MAG: extracellular solute-binding protein [Ferruginibacter sp.]|nr:extracellular solute-binding protein [Ferruginibacter sp.]
MKLTFTRILTVAACLLLFSQCNSNKKEKLVIYSPHGKELLSEFEKSFETKNPNIDIQWLDMSSQQVFDRISNESKNPQADIWWGAPATMFTRAEKSGLLEQYKPTWADQIPASAKSKNDFWYGTFSTPQVIAFNSNKITADKAPKDWNEIVGPSWKGKVVLRNPMASGTLRAIFSAMLEQSIKRTGKEDEGWNWLKMLDTNTAIYTADPTQMYAKLGGDAEVVTIWNMPDIELQKNKNKYPFGYVFPQNGTVVLTDGIAIVKGTKHLALAKEFYEFVTSKESLITQAEKFYRIPSRTDMEKDKLPNWLKTANYSALDVNWDIIAEKEAEWMKKWDNEVHTKN